jgi:RimJ/RimL family protein N-acetyltransferase
MNKKEGSLGREEKKELPQVELAQISGRTDRETFAITAGGEQVGTIAVVPADDEGELPRVIFNILQKFEHKRYASAGLVELTKFVPGTYPGLKCEVLKTNVASQRVLHTAGFVKVDENETTLFYEYQHSK